MAPSEKKTAFQMFSESGLIGGFHGSEDLAENYKEAITEYLDKKYPPSGASGIARWRIAASIEQAVQIIESVPHWETASTDIEILSELHRRLPQMDMLTLLQLIAEADERAKANR